MWRLVNEAVVWLLISTHIQCRVGWYYIWPCSTRGVQNVTTIYWYITVYYIYSNVAIWRIMQYDNNSSNLFQYCANIELTLNLCEILGIHLWWYWCEVVHGYVTASLSAEVLHELMLCSNCSITHSWLSIVVYSGIIRFETMVVLIWCTLVRKECIIINVVWIDLQQDWKDTGTYIAYRDNYNTTTPA